MHLWPSNNLVQTSDKVPRTITITPTHTHTLHPPPPLHLTFLQPDLGRPSSRLQLLLQLLNLLRVLSEQRVLGVLVDLRLVLDLLGAVGVAQRAHRFVVVVVGGGEAGHHHGFRVAAQRVLRVTRAV